MAERTQRGGRWLRRRRLKIGLLLGCAVVLTAITLAAKGSGGLDRIELSSIDARFAVRGTQGAPKDIVVVAIDDVSFEDLHLRFQDWPRTFHARVLRNLAKAKPKAVIFDVQITEPSKDINDDIALYDAAGVARPVIFATTEVDEDGGTGVFGNTAKRSADNLARIGAKAAHGLFPIDAGGVIRRMDYSIKKLQTVGIATAATVTKRPVPAPSGFTGSELIDYAGPPGTVDTVSYSKVYRGSVPASRFRGKVVVVGPTAPSLQDVHATSTGGGEMAGAEIQANAYETARRGFPLRGAGATLDTAIIVLLGLLAPLLTMRIPVLRVLPIVGVVAAGFLVAAQVAFDSGTVLLVAAPIAALLLTTVGSFAVEFFTETRERRRLRATFSRFVPEAVVDQVVERGDARLGGERLFSTVLFCDLRGFTSFSENLPAEQVIELLNHYLGEMSAAILDHGGTLVAYMGDGIMAVFGAPIELEDHADRAYGAAREMMGVRLPRFNAWINEQGMGGGDFLMGIGLNSGPVMSGNVGSERRMEYTAVGDTTNTAARLEGMTKGSGHQLFVADSTRALLADPSGLEHYGDLPIRGRQSTLTVWVPAARPDESVAGEAAVPPKIVHGG